ncbi:Cutinase transcription factor 1 alpha [Penicillium chermesinum]|nr:Cutinase transcription factor 1 alpha [Penicillium chermesinum]
MSATIESHAEPAGGSPAPSATGSTGTSGITVRNGPGGQPLSFRRESRGCCVPRSPPYRDAPRSPQYCPPIAPHQLTYAFAGLQTCHARKVRCDAASLGVPCTNCVAFSIECKIPSPKRKKNSSKSKEDARYGDSPPPQSASSLVDAAVAQFRPNNVEDSDQGTVPPRQPASIAGI